MELSFPVSRACLWDPKAVGQSVEGPRRELHVTRNCWLCVSVLPSAVHLAVRHARQTNTGQTQCLLIATVSVNQEEGVFVEVDRFDPGRVGKDGSVVPTALMPGDIAIPCQVVSSARSDIKFLSHNLSTLQQSMTSLLRSLSHTTSPEPSSLLSLRIHCAVSPSEVTIHCSCVTFSLSLLSCPITPIPIVQTALARNLSSPLPISVLQGKPKHGYLTMESSRKLVLLLHSDPKASTLPLVGVWLSGVSSVHHPLVWTVCTLYYHSPSLSDRVWGEGGAFLLLLYVDGAVRPEFWQCVAESEKEGFEIHSGEARVELKSSQPPVLLQLFPAQESSSLHTLLQAASQTHSSSLTASQTHSSSLTTSSGHSPALTASQTHSPAHTASQTHSPAHTASHIHTAPLTALQAYRDGVLVDMPTPSPHPTPAPAPRLDRDTELSCLSLLVEGPVTSAQAEREGSVPEGAATSTTLDPVADTAPSPPSSEDVIVFPDKRSKELQNDTPTTEQLLWQQERQLRALQEQVNALLLSRSPISSSDAGTNTGQSLSWGDEQAPLWVPLHPTPPSTVSPLQPSPPVSPQRSTLSSSRPSPPPSSLAQPLSPSSICSSMATFSLPTPSQSSLTSSHINVDIQSYAHTDSPPTSPSLGESASVLYQSRREEGESRPVSLLYRDQQEFYHNMLAQVNELLQSQSPSVEEKPTSSPTPPSSPLPYLHPPPVAFGPSDISVLPVPRIMYRDTLPSLAEGERRTMDDSADVIALKYLHNSSDSQTGVEGLSDVSLPTLAPDEGDQTLVHMSMATEQYLRRHNLVTALPEGRDNVLDIRRLKALPKLF